MVMHQPLGMVMAQGIMVLSSCPHLQVVFLESSSGQEEGDAAVRFHGAIWFPKSELQSWSRDHDGTIFPSQMEPVPIYRFFLLIKSLAPYFPVRPPSAPLRYVSSSSNKPGERPCHQLIPIISQTLFIHFCTPNLATSRDPHYEFSCK